MLSTNMEVWQIQVLIKLEVKATLKLFFNLEDKKKTGTDNVLCLQSIKINYMVEKIQKKT